MSEFRHEPVSGQWVIIAPERAARPTEFAVERRTHSEGFCPFCEGHEDRTPPEIDAVRPSGSPADAPGWLARVVPNRYPAVSPDVLLREGGGPFTRHISGFGRHEVVIETPAHCVSQSEQPVECFHHVVALYQRRLLALRSDRRIASALIFKNSGAAAGATIEHSHSQLVALPAVPRGIQTELWNAKEFHKDCGQCMFCAIIEHEVSEEARLLLEDEDCIALVPFASRFPFETWILPKRHESALEESAPHVLKSLGEMLHRVLIALDMALDRPAYNYIIHTEPFAVRENAAYHWHVEVVPRVTYIAGFEWGSGCAINPVRPEEAAELLRERLSEPAGRSR